jgi:lysophospholipase L1-like esterase
MEVRIYFMGLYLALGDSLTAGYGVGLQYSFPSILYQRLKNVDPSLSYLNLGVNGLTTGQLNNLVASPALSRYLQQATLITITIGSNDLLHGLPFVFSNDGRVYQKIIRELNVTLEAVGRAIRQVNKHSLLAIAAIYNPVPAAGGFIVDAHFSQSMIQQVNLYLARWAKKYRAQLIPLDQIFQGRETYLLNRDHLHPNKTGHAVIAEAFSLHLLSP